MLRRVGSDGVDDRPEALLGNLLQLLGGLHVLRRVGSDEAEDRPEPLLVYLLQLLGGVACAQEGW